MVKQYPVSETNSINRISGTKNRWWRDPVVWGFAVLAAAAYIVSSIASAEWVYSLILIGVVLMASLLVIYLTRNRETPAVPPRSSVLEGYLILAWYVVFVGISLVTVDGGIFGNEFMKYLWFVALPVLILYLVQRREGFRYVLKSIGLHREGLGKALLFTLPTYAVLLIGIAFFLPEAQIDNLQALAQEPVKLLLVIPLSFVFSLVTAAFTEEVFFRGILQTRLSSLMHSEIRGCLVAALLFGLYHLPYAYFMESWPTQGNIAWAISSVIVEQAVTGLILGVLWLRTRNLAAPILLHALINTPVMMTMLHMG